MTIKNLTTMGRTRSTGGGFRRTKSTEEDFGRMRSMISCISERLTLLLAPLAGTRRTGSTVWLKSVSYSRHPNSRYSTSHQITSSAVFDWIDVSLISSSSVVYPFLKQ